MIHTKSPKVLPNFRFAQKVWTDDTGDLNNKYGCHFKNIDQTGLFFDKPIPGAQVHVCVRYKPSTIKSVCLAWLSTHIHTQNDNNNDNTDDTRRTIHDYLAFMPYEPATGTFFNFSLQKPGFFFFRNFK